MEGGREGRRREGAKERDMTLEVGTLAVSDVGARSVQPADM